MACKEALDRKVLHPLKDFLRSIKDKNEPTQPEVDKLILEWVKIYKEINVLDMYSFGVKLNNKKLLDFKREFEVDALNEKIVSHISPKQNQWQEIATIINIVIQEFEKEVTRLK